MEGDVSVEETGSDETEVSWWLPRCRDSPAAWIVTINLYGFISPDLLRVLQFNGRAAPSHRRVTPRYQTFCSCSHSNNKT